MIELSPHPAGVVLPVRAQPGAGKNAIRGEHDGMLKVSVTQIAEKGKANKALVETIAKGLGIKKSQVELLVGETQAQKKFLIRGITAEQLAERLSSHGDITASAAAPRGVR